MNKRGKIATWLLAFVMILGMAFTASPTTALAKSANVKSVSVKSSLTDSKSIVYVAKGKSVKLSTTVTVTPDKAANKKVTYKSQSSKIATVSASGVVKGKKAGTTKITVTSKTNKKKKATIKVKVVSGAVSKVELDKTSASLEKGKTLSLSASVTAAKGAVKTLAWESSNSKVATVSSSGVVTAVSAGSANITASAIDGSGKQAVCKVTVTDNVSQPSKTSTVSLTSMEILSGNVIRFTLNQAYALKADQIAVDVKTLAGGTYQASLRVSSISTNDHLTYTLVTNDFLSQAEYVRLTISSLTGTKTLEKQYLMAAADFTEDVVYAGTVGESVDYEWGSISFDSGVGYSKYTIDKLPAGLKAENKYYGLAISGTPTTAGITKAVVSAVDETGNTLTKNVTFVIGSDTKLQGAATPQYVLASSGFSAAVYATGGSGWYSYEIISAPDGMNLNLEGNWLYGYDISAGDYTVTVRATDVDNEDLYCDIQVEIHAVQGFTVSGCITDAQGYPMANASVILTNKDRSNRYTMDGIWGYTDENGIYTVHVYPGTYDIGVYHGYESEAAYACTFVTDQTLTTTRSGLDFTLPLYRVSLTSDDPDADLYWDWYIDGKYAGYGKTLYLKPGTYELESYTYTIHEDMEDVGDWFNGITKTVQKTKKKMQAKVTVVDQAVTAKVTEVTVSEPTTTTTSYPGAKDTGYSYDQGYDYLPYEYVDDREVEGYYAALSVTLDDPGVYILSSERGYAYLYDEEGNCLDCGDSVYDEDSDLIVKTYTGLEAGTYYIGSGDIDESDYNITLTHVSTDTEEPETETDTELSE